jgi:superfamily II DNA helicase RecQ
MSNLVLKQDIEAGVYSIVVVGPELLLHDGGRFEIMWRNKEFVRRLMYFVFDEADCLITWNNFRKEYELLGSRLRIFLPERIPFYAPSATLHPPGRLAVRKSLRLRPENTIEIVRSNDRPSLHLAARVMRHPADTYRDLEFLLNLNPSTGCPAPFLVFLRSYNDCREAACSLRAKLPLEHQDKIVWFDSIMTMEFRQLAVEKLRKGEIWGICSTDAFGRVIIQSYAS